MIPRDVHTAADLRRIIEKRGAKNVTIAVPNAKGLLRTKYISRDKQFSVLKNGWCMPPVVLVLDFGDIKLCSFFEHA